MLVELPKRMIFAGGDIPLPSDEPYLILTAIKNGIMLYSLAGKLLGQIFTDKKGATVAVADSYTYRVTKTNGGAAIKPAENNISVAVPTYDIFGNVDKYSYELYEYRKGTVQPFGAAKVTTSPATDLSYKAFLSEDCNIFRSLLLVAAISLLTEGENLKKKRT